MNGERKLGGGILSCNDYHGSSSWGNIKTSEKRGCTYKKNKVHNTKMQMQKQQTILYWFVYLWNWGRIL